MVSSDDGICMEASHAGCPSLAGCWHADQSTWLGLRLSKDLSGFASSAAKDRPVFNLLQTVAGKMCPSLSLFDFWRKQQFQLTVAEDLSKASLLLGKEFKQEYLLNGHEQSVVSELCPFGTSRFKTVLCSHSHIRWQLALPQQLASIHGSWELLSEEKSLLTYETGTGHHLVSVKLHRAEDLSLFQKTALLKSRKQSYVQSCGPLPEDGVSGVCRLFRC